MYPTAAPKTAAFAAKIASHDKPLFKSVPATGVRGDQPASDILKRLVNPVKSGTPMNPFGVKV